MYKRIGVIYPSLNRFTITISQNKAVKENFHAPLLNGFEEQVDEPVERVLVHGVDIGQVCDGEEQHGGPLGHAFVRLAGLVDVGSGFVGNLRVS